VRTPPEQQGPSSAHALPQHGRHDLIVARNGPPPVREPVPLVLVHPPGRLHHPVERQMLHQDQLPHEGLPTCPADPTPTSHPLPERRPPTSTPAPDNLPAPTPAQSRLPCGTSPRRRSSIGRASVL